MKGPTAASRSLFTSTAQCREQGAEGGALHGVGPEGEPVLRARAADLESLDFARPALPQGLGDAGDEVVADLDEPCPLRRVRSQE
ncbi:hypothetical protein GCM10014715_64320 [Streptomyces spiralis]|uniref:Uncharacterized protein n=1 Tax=Streptomyces spiralis TaxID=66376 RepID=A0A919ACJ1_9ACTN|nr:hypothetical protein GCM10014715_64320 [Streptomyces spiralis]